MTGTVGISQAATSAIPAEFGTADVAAARIGAACLRDGPVGRVGLEIEAHCFDPTDPMRRPSWAELTDVIATVPELPGGSTISVEPGGAVELSGPPLAGPVPAVTAMSTDRAILRSAFARAGLTLVLLGADPLRPPRRVNPGPRYHAMETFFAASGTAVAGAAMMTSTASIQVNVDAGPRAGWSARVRLAHALGPVMIAIAANSPLLGGTPSGWRSSRQRVWGQLDSRRCGPILGAGGDATAQDPARDWARYALRAPVMLVNSLPGEPSATAQPVTTWVPFADWVDGSAVLGGRRANAADLEYHLTTLFPPVRPRGWLEIRYLDSVADELWPALVFTLVTLLDDPAAAAIAAEATEPVATAWDRAARIGLTDRELYAAANRCVRTAAERAPAELTDAMTELLRAVEQGRCPADDFTDLVARHGVAAAVDRVGREQL